MRRYSSHGPESAIRVQSRDPENQHRGRCRAAGTLWNAHPGRPARRSRTLWGNHHGRGPAACNQKSAVEKTDKPDSVPPGICSHTEVIISLGFELPRTSSDLPEDPSRASRLPILRREPAGVFLFGLASGDAYRAGDVTTTAVGSYPTVSPLPEPQRLDWDPIALAIGGLFSVVLVSDRSAWVLPSALPMKSGLSSRSVTATSDHPVFSLAP